MKLPDGLELLTRPGSPYYYVRGTVSGREIYLSTRTQDQARAAEIACQMAAARSTFYGPHMARLVLSLDQIQQLKEYFACGLYFLLLAGKIQYIGQSHRIEARIKQHREERRINFDDWRVLRCEVIDLDLAEALYVRHYQPLANRGVNRDRTKKWEKSTAAPTGFQ